MPITNINRVSANELFCRALEESGMSQTALAEAAGVTQARISYLTREGIPSPALAKKIEKLIGFRAVLWRDEDIMLSGAAREEKWRRAGVE